MYLFESTPEAIDTERKRLVEWQMRFLQLKDASGRPVYEDGLPQFTQEALPRALAAVGAPKPLARHKLKDYKDGVLGEARAQIEMLLTAEAEADDSVKKGMALVGHASTGKTSFATAVLRRMMWNYRSVKYIDIEDLAKFFTTWIELSQNAKHYEDDYADRADSWRRELWRMHDVYDFLVIDDIGRARVPEFVYDELHSILRKRVSGGTYTIVTANKSLEEFGVMIGDSCKHFIRREFTVLGFSPEDTLV